MATGEKNQFVPLNCIGLLFIEPKTLADKVPVIDKLTRMMTGAMGKATTKVRWRGVHTCVCGAHSDNADYRIMQIFDPDFITNSLAVHYLARHRNEIPESELKKVESLPYGEAEPTELHLDGWNFKIPLNWRTQ